MSNILKMRNIENDIFFCAQLKITIFEKNHCFLSNTKFPQKNYSQNENEVETCILGVSNCKINKLRISFTRGMIYKGNAIM